MIKNNFYPTVTTGDIETTAGITSITDNRIKTEFFDPYFMGYLTPDNAPINIRPIKYALGDSLDISPVDGNIAWGYLVGGNEATYAKTIYRTDGAEITQYNSGNGDRYLINAVEMARVCLSANIDIIICTRFIMDDYYIDGVGVDGLVHGGQGAGNIQEVHAVFNINDFLSMYNHGGTFLNTTVRDTSSISPIYNIDFPLDIDFNDMPKDGRRTLYIPFPDHGCTVAVQIIGYRISADTVIVNNGVTQYANIKPFSAYSFDNNKIAIIPGKFERNIIRFEFNTSTLQFSNLSSYSDSTVSATPIDEIDGYLMGAFEVQFTADTFAIADRYHNIIFGNTYYCDSVSNAATMVFRITSVFGIDDIYKYLLLFHKNTTTPSDSYSTNDIVTIFDATDTPTLDTMSGSLSEIVVRLRPWQLPGADISANDFTPGDIPTPEPEDTDSTGDDITDTNFNNITIGAGNNFVTLYGMTSAGVSDMGEKLWASLSDPTYWQTVGTVFTNDFSINPADMLKYFLSLRYFPFNLGLLPYDPSDGVFIGRATAPLLPSAGIGRPIRMQKSIAQLDGGSLTISRKYNDFRDFEPCTTVQIHVPFCGTVDVPASEVVGKTLYLSYKIDLQTGAMLGVIAVQSNTYYVIATVAGSCGASIPITANNNIEFLQRIATVAGSGISGGISGGIKGASVGGEVGAVAGAIAGSVGGGVGALAGLPPVTVHKQGNASGFANLGGVPCAYVTIQRQRYSIPENYGHTSGYACDVSETVGNLSGFAVCENVDTSGLSCNSTERAEIKRLLESGIYI